MPMPKAELFEDAIGQRRDEPGIQLLLRSLPGRQEASELEDESYIEAPDHGLAFTFDRRSRLASIFFEGRAAPQSTAPFAGELPRGLTFGMPRSAVRARLGQPSDARESMASPISGDGLCWDRYDWPNMSLHVQYSVDGLRIDLVTLMAPWSVPH